MRLRVFRATDLDDSMAVVADDRITRWLSFDSLSREQQARRLVDIIERARNHPRPEYYLGFVYEGRIRDHVHTNGAWRDSELYSFSRMSGLESEHANHDNLTGRPGR